MALIFEDRLLENHWDKRYDQDQRVQAQKERTAVDPLACLKIL